MYCVARRCYCFLLDWTTAKIRRQPPIKRHPNWALNRYVETAKSQRQQKHSSGEEWRADKAVHSIQFSVGGNRLLLARPANNRGNNLRGRKYTIITVSELTFLGPGRPTAPGCLCLWGTLCCVWGRPPALSFFTLFHLSDHRGRDPLTLQPHSSSTRRLNRAWSGGKRRGHGWLTLPTANQSAAFVLRSALLSCFLFAVFDDDRSDNLMKII